jgi:hypothetical protein
MKEKLEAILINISEAIQADDSGTCHLIIARDAVENALSALERSVSYIMGNNGEERKIEPEITEDLELKTCTCCGENHSAYQGTQVFDGEDHHFVCEHCN